MIFEEAYSNLWEGLGTGKKMVLSTSLNDIVSSRSMSIIFADWKLYFQTDITLRKYEQIMANPSLALCVDNIQIEGKCREVGKPEDNEAFLALYKANFPSSFTRYSSLKNERLFEVKPSFIERWLYIEGDPYMEIFDVLNKKYELKQYIGE